MSDTVSWDSGPDSGRVGYFLEPPDWSALLTRVAEASLALATVR